MSESDCVSIARMIDHSLLGPAMSDEELATGCRSAAEWGVALACVKPYFVAQARRLLEGSAVKVGTAVGFPHGSHTILMKVAEAKAAVDVGAQELDMVINIGKAKSADWGYLEEEIGGVVNAAHSGRAVLKVTLQNRDLTDEEKRRLCRICRASRADFIRNSTGYGGGPPTDEDLRLMLQEAGDEMGVKAAGGVGSYAHVAHLRAMGVRRIGARDTAQILTECRESWRPA
jgi:deoxyribose-phosphate aldolase